MVIKTLNAIERNAVDMMLPPVTVEDSVAIDVIDDSTLKYGDIGYIEIFNAGDNKCYFAIGRTCDDVNNFNGYLAAGQAYSAWTRQRISVYSVGGTVIARTVTRRADVDATVQ